MKKVLSIVTLTILTLAISTSFAFSKNYHWKITSHLPPSPPFNDDVKYFIQKVEENSKGVAKFTLYEGTLGAPTDTWDMVRKNVVQFGYSVDGFNSNRMPIGNLVGLPFEIPDPKCNQLVLEAWTKAGYLKELTDNFKLLFTMPTYTINLFLRDKKVLKMEDWQGLKIEAATGIQGQTINMLGGSTVSMPGSEAYMALSTGVIDGRVTVVAASLARKLNEVTKFALRQPLYSGMFFLLMNKKTWDNLPIDMQTIIEDAANETASIFAAKRQNDEEKMWESYGKLTEVYRIDQDEVTRWKNATKKIAEAYINETAGQGYPVRDAYDLMNQVVGDYLSEN